jgi:NADH-quinone oxidoreductase subunit D
MVDDFRKLLDVEVPKRAQYLRVIVMELAKLRTIICNSILGVDTRLHWISLCFQFREKYMRFMKKFVVLD